MSTPSSGSIDETADWATTTPESWTDFLAGMSHRPYRCRGPAYRRYAATGAFSTGWGGGFESTSTAATRRTAMATALSPTKLLDRRPGTPSRATRGAATKWWTAPQERASATSPSFTSSTCPYPVLQRSCTCGRRSTLRYVPAASSRATSTVARREKRRNATRRRSGAAGQTPATSCTSPPTQSAAALRCTQSASSESREWPASAAECPDNESPDANASPSTNAGHSSACLPVSHARYSRAATSAKPSSIVMNATPKRVPPEIGDRSP